MRRGICFPLHISVVAFRLVLCLSHRLAFVLYADLFQLMALRARVPAEASLYAAPAWGRCAALVPFPGLDTVGAGVLGWGLGFHGDIASAAILAAVQGGACWVCLCIKAIKLFQRGHINVHDLDQIVFACVAAIEFDFGFQIQPNTMDVSSTCAKLDIKSSGVIHASVSVPVNFQIHLSNHPFSNSH